MPLVIPIADFRRRTGPVALAAALALLAAGCPPPDRVETVPAPDASRRASVETPTGADPRPAGDRVEDDDGHTDDQPLPPAPWQAHPAVPAARAPTVARAEWRRAENRRTCALLALAADPDLDMDPGAPREPAPRRANFSGGWAVAYDLPGHRSAWGVAGTGSPADGDAFAGWNNRQRWADGSQADYGPEGGGDEAGAGNSDRPWLAYLTIPGQGCLYNVWSGRGRRHLESLLDRLRFVEGHSAPTIVSTTAPPQD